jgi:hypothetical protein
MLRLAVILSLPCRCALCCLEVLRGQCRLHLFSNHLPQFLHYSNVLRCKNIARVSRGFESHLQPLNHQLRERSLPHLGVVLHLVV